MNKIDKQSLMNSLEVASLMHAGQRLDTLASVVKDNSHDQHTHYSAKQAVKKELRNMSRAGEVYYSSYNRVWVLRKR